MLQPLPSGTSLARLDAIADGGCLEIPCEGPGDAPSVVVVRSGARAWAYHNLCPHFSLPLNSRPGLFLVGPGAQIMCAYHCSYFRFEDGRCVEGPAEGTSLVPVPVRVVRGEVLVTVE